MYYIYIASNIIFLGAAALVVLLIRKSKNRDQGAS